VGFYISVLYQALAYVGLGRDVCGFRCHHLFVFWFVFYFRIICSFLAELLSISFGMELSLSLGYVCRDRYFLEFAKIKFCIRFT
jgi:hypothetical protein